MSFTIVTRSFVMLCSLSPGLHASIIDEAALGMVSNLVACKVLSTPLRFLGCASQVLLSHKISLAHKLVVTPAERYPAADHS